eukprot:tig00001368_g8414.t1
MAFVLPAAATAAQCRSKVVQPQPTDACTSVPARPLGGAGARGAGGVFSGVCVPDRSFFGSAPYLRRRAHASLRSTWESRSGVVRAQKPEPDQNQEELERPSTPALDIQRGIIHQEHDPESSQVDFALLWQVCTFGGQFGARRGSYALLLAHNFKTIALPYWNSQDKWKARGSLAGLIALGLMQSGISVTYSFVGRDFWNALAAKDSDLFFKQLAIYAACFTVGTPIVVMYGYFRDSVSIAWREWLTKEFLAKYLEGRSYYNLGALSRGAGAEEIDNPDQRICEDVLQFADASLAFFLVLLNSVVDLVSFSGILWSIYPPLWVVLLFYSAFGTGVTTLFGRRLVNLNFAQLKREADLRFSLIRVRENAESIAFFGGEGQEGRVLGTRLEAIVANYRRLIATQRNLAFFTTAYRYFIQILPAAVVAPLYFAGRFEIGVVQQAYSAFNHVLGDLSVIVNQVKALSAFSAGVSRLGEFDAALAAASSAAPSTLPAASAPVPAAPSRAPLLASIAAPTQLPEIPAAASAAGPSAAAAAAGPSRIEMRYNGVHAGDGGAGPVLAMRGVGLQTPDRAKYLVRELSLELERGGRLLIVGDSGSGKSSLLRAVAGLWTCGEGAIERPAPPLGAFFIPQRPYMTVGSLRAQLLYPFDDGTEAAGAAGEAGSSRTEAAGGSRTEADVAEAHRSVSDDELLAILQQVNLAYLPKRFRRWALNGEEVGNPLDIELDWSAMLSLGEQQRLSFARLLLRRPALALLDEATSALDVANEARMYGLLAGIPGMAVVSVGHRPTLLPFHERVLRLHGDSTRWEIASPQEAEATFASAARLPAVAP